MTLLEAIIQGVIQGATEFLPVSSSGHLSIFQYFTGRSGESALMFTIMLHMGTLLAVVIVFHKTLWDMIVEFCLMFKDIFTGKFSFKNMPPARKMIFLLIVSLIPMIGTYFFLDYFEALATDNSIIAEGVCLIITSLLLFVSDSFSNGRKTAKDMRYTDAVVVGAMQAIAPMPGLSRSGSTISAGLIMGLEREFAVAFSFIMGIPAVLGANLLEIGKVVENGGIGIPTSILLAGIVTSLVVGLASIFLVKWLVNSNKFVIFAWYTLVAGVVVVGLGIFEHFSDHLIQNILTQVIY